MFALITVLTAASSSSGVLNLTDPDVRTWATIFQRYFTLSKTLEERAGTNRTGSFETVFLLANGALSAAAAKNVEVVTASPEASTNTTQNAQRYSYAVGIQAVKVATSVEARDLASINITAYTQIAGESAIYSANAAANGSPGKVAAAADRAVVAASSSLLAAQLVAGFAPAPLDVPY